jgi:hypothetical protein
MSEDEFLEAFYVVDDALRLVMNSLISNKSSHNHMSISRCVGCIHNMLRITIIISMVLGVFMLVTNSFCC